jgi:putative transposase
MSARRALLQAGDRLPVTRQCRRRGLSRSTASSRPLAVPAAELSRMRAIDESPLKYPCYGRRRVRDELAHRGHGVTHRTRSQRRMRPRGPAARSPKRRPSAPGIGHQRYPYRLRGLTINRPNQVWAAASCYLPMARGCL